LSTNAYIGSVQKTFAIERNALDATLASLDENEFSRACELILTRKGRVVVTGIGKSGHVGRKIASTLSSTGTPSLFLHAGEAAHGDLGFIDSDDTIIMLSKSGESDELATILPALASKHVPIIAITAHTNSRLAKAASSSGGALLLIAIPEEACQRLHNSFLVMRLRSHCSRHGSSQVTISQNFILPVHLAVS
jgi:arabinose-5-phosphate isomerase